MGKGALITVVAFILVGGFYSMSMQESMVLAEEHLSDQQREHLARNAAVVGFQLAKQELTDNFDASSPVIQGSYETATYYVTISVVDNIATIKSVGKMTGTDARITIKRKIAKESHTEYERGISPEVPDFMKKALITEGTLRLNGNVEVDALQAQGSDGSQLNADIHTNGTMDANGKAANIRGFGTYAGGVTDQALKHADAIFNPYDNSSNSDVMSEVDPIDIPYLDFDTQEIADNYGDRLDDAHLDFADATDAEGNVKLLQDTHIDFADHGATREDPYIWHIDGDLEVAGPVKFSGYVMFLVDGDIKFNGNVESGGNGNEDYNETHIAMYAMGDSDLYPDGKTIAVGGSTDLVSAQIFCKGDLEFHGNPKVVGTVAVGGTATISGNPTIVYAPASPALTTHWQQPLIEDHSYRLLTNTIY